MKGPHRGHKSPSSTRVTHPHLHTITSLVMELFQWDLIYSSFLVLSSQRKSQAFWCIFLGNNETPNCSSSRDETPNATSLKMQLNNSEGCCIGMNSNTCRAASYKSICPTLFNFDKYSFLLKYLQYSSWTFIQCYHSNKLWMRLVSPCIIWCLFWDWTAYLTAVFQRSLLWKNLSLLWDL